MTIDEKYILDLETNLVKMIPLHMHNTVEVAIQKAIEKQLIRLNDCIIDFYRQLYLDSATWGLTYWENMVMLEPDLTLDTDERISRVKARLRSLGTTTVEVIKNISNAYSNGETDVIEKYNEYYFIIKFISQVGIPSKLDLLKKQIHKIKPAHLDFRFEFTYRTWDDILHTGMKWGEATDHNFEWDDLKQGDIRPFDDKFRG